ncbi:serine dehydratase beta subunit [Streptomyces sp. BK340]|nr:serine dehydratase beta subunit [Streptomyces sp. BK340]
MRQWPSCATHGVFRECTFPGSALPPRSPSSSSMEIAAAIGIELHGSPAATGIGHGTDKAVLHYCHRFIPGADDDSTVRFLLTAAAMAAVGLTELMGGTPPRSKPPRKVPSNIISA